MSFTSAPMPVSRWRDVRISAAARGASIAGDLLSATALLLTLQGRGAGGYAVAALLIAATGPLVLLAPLTGRLADRVDSRVLIVAVATGQAACCAAMAFVSSTALLVALVAVVASGAAVTQPTLAALVPEMVRKADLARAAAVGQTATAIGTLVGPPLAGFLVGVYGLRVPLLLDGLTFLCVAVAGLLIVTRRRSSPLVEEGSPLPVVAVRGEPSSATGWTLRSDRLLGPMIAMIGLVVTVVAGVNVVDVFFVRETLHASTTMYGVLTAIWPGSMAAGSWLVARRRTDDAGYALLMAGVLALCCAAIGVAGLMPRVAWLVPLFLVGGAANGAMNSITAVLISRRVPAGVRGRAFAYLGAVANAASLAGFAVGGVLVGLVAPGTLLVASGTAGVVAAVSCLPLMLRAARRDRLRTAAAPPATLAA